MKHLFFLLIILGSIIIPANCYSQEYVLVWEDNFDGATLDSSIWNIEQRVGIWNTGSNHELEHYTKDNVTIGDDGSGNNCLILTAKNEDYNGYGFTSGRINTKGKFAFTYGKLVARIKLPNLENGLWPAFWTLGYSEAGWPAQGEIDIMEMGHSAFISNGTVNRTVKSACHWDVNGQYAGYSGNTDKTFSNDLYLEYHDFILVWTPTTIATYLDSVSASTKYFEMTISGATESEFRDLTHYLILNLAVGGSLPGITNQAGITAPLPANMYIDYIKLYQTSGEGNYNDSANAVFGVFGVYEETVAVDMNMDLGFDASLSTTGITERAGETAKEGTKAISYNVTSNTNFKLAINSEISRNMENYANGSVQFWFKSESHDSILVGVSDTTGNEAFITLKEGSTLNPLRNGEWQFAWIPLSELASDIDIKALKSMLIVKGNFEQDGYISIDRVIWSESVFISPDANYYGVYAEHDSIKSKLNFSEGGRILVWNGFSGGTSTAFFGTDVLTYNPNTGTWNGFGIHSDDPLDLSNFYNGALHFSYKTSSTADIEIGFKNSADLGWKKIFTGSGQIVRDGNWHEFQVNLKDFTFDGGAFTSNDLKDIVIPFYAVGTVQIALDEIYLSKDGVALDYPGSPVSTKDKITDLDISVFPIPSNDFISIKGIEQNTQITIFDQLGKIVLLKEVEESNEIDISRLKKGIYYVQVKSLNFNSVFQIVKD